MELKLLRITVNALHNQLLIEPVWNWNPVGHRLQARNWEPFNRTSMELKPWCRWMRGDSRCPPFNRTSMELKRRRRPTGGQRNHLLIEPVWNWNLRSEFYLDWNPKLLIEPVWNWNVNIKGAFWTTSTPFNRTSMELKPKDNPAEDVAKGATFNRTSMELKRFAGGCGKCVFSLPFNRTSMELKHDGLHVSGNLLITFNRTSMELKLCTVRPLRGRLRNF